MLKALLKKHLPDTDTLKNHKNLQFLGNRLHDPNLWHLNRHSVALAFAIGLFCAWIPTPGQMAIAAVAAFYIGANLPIAVGLVWLTNPLTMPPLFYFAYRVGLWIMDRPSPATDFQFSIEGVFNGLSDIWAPFLLGCLFVGILSAVTGYYGIHYFWRRNTLIKWHTRQQKRSGVIMPVALNYTQKTLDFLNTWLSSHPEIQQKALPIATTCWQMLSPSLIKSAAFLKSCTKRIKEFVPFND